MATLPIAFYDAFSDRAFGGSQAAVVSDASELDGKTRFRIAKELGLPATAFVSHADSGSVTAQFYSTVAELPMCGHGTMALMTRMVEEGLLPCPEDTSAEVTLQFTIFHGKGGGQPAR